MSDCCAPASDHGDKFTGSVGNGGQCGICPSCRLKAKPVATITVKNLVVDHTRVDAEQSFSFCRTPDCAVVYFSGHEIFRKPDLKVRVGLKEHEDPVPLCYCFGYSREDLRRDIAQHGTSEILNRIKAEVQRNYCACNVKNPSGSCCLGDINRAVKETHEAIGVPSR